VTGSRSGGGCPRFSEAIHAAISPIVLGAIKDVPESTKNLFASVDLARRLGLRLRAYWLDIGRGGRRPNLARYGMDLGFPGVGRHGPGQDDHGPQLRQGPPGLRQPDPGRQAGRLLGRAIDPVRHQVGDEVDRLDPDGRAIKDQRITFDTKPNDYVPGFATPPTSNLDKGWQKLVTVRQLATQTAGFPKTGGFGALLFQPGTGWYYSDGGPNWLADLLTLRFSQDLRQGSRIS
jgi:hypothetical protein